MCNTLQKPSTVSTHQTRLNEKLQKIHGLDQIGTWVQNSLDSARPFYKKLVEDILSQYHKLGCNMYFHVLHSHLDFFPDNCGMVSDKHVHQDFATMQQRYQEKWSTFMLADYCWTLARDIPERTYKRQAKRRRK